MILLLLVTTLMVGIIAGIVALKTKSDVAGGISFGALLGAFLTVFIAVMGPVDNVMESVVIDERIALYQEENEAIEANIQRIVEQYMEHEKDVFDISRIDSATTLIQLYPELKSDKMVVAQMEIYLDNNETIKWLRNKKLDCEKSKFILYFGGRKGE